MDAVVAINLTVSGEGPASGVLIAIDRRTGSATTLPVAVPEAKAPVVSAPKKLTLRVESMRGVTEERLKPEVVFPVAGAPLTAVASGSAGAAIVELTSTEAAGPEFKLKTLNGYGNIVTNFDVNGAAEGGDLELTIHHRRPGLWAFFLLALGSASASALAAWQRHRQREALKTRYAEERAPAGKAHKRLMGAVAAAPGINDTTVAANWALETAVPALSEADQKDTAKLGKHREAVDAYTACCEFGRRVVSVYRYFHNHKPASPIVNALRDAIQRGTGIDPSSAKTRLASDSAVASEARSLHKALLAAREHEDDDKRRNGLDAAIAAVHSIADLSTRQALVTGWAVLYRTSTRVSRMQGIMEFAYTDIVAESVDPAGRLPTAPAPQISVRTGGMSAPARLLGTKAAGVVAAVLGLAIALVVDLGSTFGANTGWGTSWDQLAAFGRAFSITGAVQIARTLGAAASEA